MKEKTQAVSPDKKICIRRRPRGCHWTSIHARSPCGKKILNTYPSHCCDSLISNYQCPALRWMNEHICVDRRQVISSSHIEDLWSLWFQFLHRLKNHVFEGMANPPCSAELLWSKVFPSLPIPSVALCWPDTFLCPCSPTHTKGFAFSSGHSFWLNHALLTSTNDLAPVMIQFLLVKEGSTFADGIKRRADEKKKYPSILTVREEIPLEETGS